MSERTTVREVFTEVEADPDAILEAAGVDSPAELIAGGGRHDPVADEAADETTVDDLLENLQDAAAETEQSTERAADREGATDRDGSDADDGRRERGTDEVRPESRAAADREFSDAAVGDPAVTVLEGDGAAIDEVVGDAPSDRSEPDADPGPTLAGGEPTVTRVASDRFGCV